MKQYRGHSSRLCWIICTSSQSQFVDSANAHRCIRCPHTPWQLLKRLRNIHDFLGRMNPWGFCEGSSTSSLFCIRPCCHLSQVAVKLSCLPGSQHFPRKGFVILAWSSPTANDEWVIHGFWLFFPTPCLSEDVRKMNMWECWSQCGLAGWFKCTCYSPHNPLPLITLSWTTTKEVCLLSAHTGVQTTK